jgi:hypothetical protein
MNEEALAIARWAAEPEKIIILIIITEINSIS